MIRFILISGAAFVAAVTYAAGGPLQNVNGTTTASDSSLGTASYSNSTAFILDSGTISAARMPALTGDVTSSAGAVATTVTTPKFNWAGTTGNTAIAANTTYFFTPNNSNATLPTSDVSGGTRIPVMRTITLQNFCAVQSAVSGSGKNVTYTVMTNGVSTGITFAINGNAALTGSDSTHTATLLATSSTPIEIGIKIVSDAASGTPKICWSLEGK